MRFFESTSRLLRANKYIEICAYLIQNCLKINSQGGGSFGKSAKEMHYYFTTVAENYILQLGADAFSQKVVLELGTGFSRSGMLHLIKEYDVKQVFCFDKFNCLDPIEEEIIKHNNLESYMNRLTYIEGEYEEILEHVDVNSVDTIVSNAVLEFVVDLDELIKVLSTIAKIESVSYHKVDLKCHNKFKTSGELYFHTFSDRLWNLMGNRVGQLSRRLPESYKEIFKKYSFSCSTHESFFSNECMLHAKKYLKRENIENFKVSDIDFFLKKDA